MSHDPKLTIYTIALNPKPSIPINTNKWLFRNLIGEGGNTTPLQDSFIIAQIFTKFIRALDTPEMYSDENSKKCMTANQTDIASDEVNANIHLHSHQFIIEGKVEGGSYGRKRKKTSTLNKAENSVVNVGDAITEDFYFLLYTPIMSNKSILMVQSYSDDTIDTVMKKFWVNFLSHSTTHTQPTITRFIPQSIIDDFRRNSTVSGFTFSTNIPGETLLENVNNILNRNYKVTVQVTPITDNLSINEFEQTIEPLKNTGFARNMNLGQFTNKKATLTDNTTNKSSPFELDSAFEIEPTILLSKYIDFGEGDIDFNLIKNYCFSLLEDIKSEIYIQNAIQER